MPRTRLRLSELFMISIANTTMGIAAIATFLNNSGYKKKLRQNNTIEGFSASFVKGVLDNPVYCGKLAFGRRKNEKIPGTRNEYHVVKQDKAKANVATGIPELIEIAVGKYFRKNQEDKHKRDAKNGWYRYDSRFALPVYGDKCELERYNIFHASLLVRHSNDGKMYLYDIIDIKKETSNSLSE